MFQNQFRAPNITAVQLLDHQRARYSFAANTYSSDAISTRWFSVNGTFHDLAGWSAAVGEMKPFQGLPIDPATTPDIEAYHASIGGTPSFTAFLDQARQQSRQNWRVAYTAGRVIDFVRQRIGLELIAFTPGLDVRLTTSQFAPGTQMVVTAVLSGGTPSTVVDAYIVVRLPDGQMLSLQPGGSIVAGLVPIARGVTPFDFTTEVFRYLFNGNEPPGVYTWMAALATQGTLHLVSPIAQFSFVVR